MFESKLILEMQNKRARGATLGHGRTTLWSTNCTSRRACF